MTELHWALLAVAVALLAGLFLYGKWQERRALQRLDESMRAGVGDALFDGTAPTSGRPSAASAARHAPPRIEPRFDSSEPSSATTVAGAEERPAEPASPQPSPREPAAAEVDRADRAEQLRADPAVWVEDPLLDFVVELRCSHAFDGVAALEARAQVDRLGLPLPTHLAVWDAKTQQWSAPDRFGFYSEMLIAVQMATRRQLLGEIDASRFIAAVQQIAVTIDADLDVPDMARLVMQATQLDALAARFDVQITLTLLAAEGAAWSRAQLTSALAEHGVDSAAPLLWVRLDPQSRPLLAASAPAVPASRLALTLDVPVAAVDATPLATLFGTARELAQRLQATVVDDNGRPLAAAAEPTIEAELQTLYGEMRAAGIEPGGSRARRLYASG
jgi:hypothetical protein